MVKKKHIIYIQQTFFPFLKKARFRGANAFSYVCKKKKSPNHRWNKKYKTKQKNLAKKKKQPLASSLRKYF